MSLSISTDPLGQGGTVKVGLNTVLTFDTTSGYVLTPATGDRSTKIATTQMFSNEFTASFGASGYQKLPSGLIMQWGKTASSTAEGARAVTFPIAFPNACYLMVATADNTTGGFNGAIYDSWAQVQTFNTTTATLIVANSGTTPPQSTGIYWIAIGR